MAGPRSRRRPTTLVMAGVAVSVVLLIAQGSASSRPKANEAVEAYLDRIRPGVQQSAAQGADFAEVRANAVSLGRDGIDRRLDRLASEVRTTLTSLDTVAAPPSLRVAQAYLVAALGVRAKAVAEARPAMDAVLSAELPAGPGVTGAVDELRVVGQDLGLGDRAMDLFVGSLPARAGVGGSTPWITDPSIWAGARLAAFADTLRSSASAKPVHDIAMVAFQTDPAAVSVGADGSQVIPASKATAVSMVIENVGNQPERQVVVGVVFTPVAGPIQSLRDFIDLAPGQTRALTLRPLPADAGTAGSLTVAVQPVPGEINTANNSLVTSVIFK